MIQVGAHLGPQLPAGEDAQMVPKLRALWARREKYLKNKDSQQDLDARLKDLDYLRTQRPKLAKKVTTVWRGEDILNAMIKNAKEKAEAAPQI